MYRWIKSYLHNQRARVTVDNAKSKKILLRYGVPQGGVIPPTLFLIFINDLISQLPDAVKCAMYADDTSFTSASKSTLYTLDKVQNQALRLITGAMRSTPIKVMEDTTAITQ